MRPSFAFVAPPAAFPVTEVRFLQQLDARYPLGLLHSKLAGDEDPDRIAVNGRKLFAVHLPGQKVLLIPQALESVACGEAVGGVDGGMRGLA